MSIVIFPPFAEHSENVEHVCSVYHFDSQNNNWEEAEQDCKRRNYDGLVSMQTEGEWVYFKSITANREQKMALKKTRWFIGLQYLSHKWCWSNDTKACISLRTNETGYSGYWRWSRGEPNNLDSEHCVEMFNGGEYNNIDCSERFSHTGFICEKKAGM